MPSIPMVFCTHTSPEKPVFKLKIKYKVNIMTQRSVILLLIMVVWVGCGEDELGGIAKVTGTLPAIGS